jgi:hypothetical protein
MNTTGIHANLSVARRVVLIGKLFDAMTEGYQSTNALSKRLGVSRPTIDRYRPVVDDLITKTKLDRTQIRNLELQRAYKIIEMLMDDLNKSVEHKDRIGYYNQIAKHSSRIALITGLNVETQVTIDQKQLVIIRADTNKKPVIKMNDTDNSILQTEDILGNKSTSSSNHQIRE